MNVGALRTLLARYPDDAHVGVHVIDHKDGHRFISVHRVDMTEPNEDVNVRVVWISAAKEDDS